jgi:hypothetical protein
MRSRKSVIRASATALAFLGVGSANALGPWTSGFGQASGDDPGVAARESIAAAAGGFNFIASFGKATHTSGDNVLAGLQLPDGTTPSFNLAYSATNPLAATSWGTSNASVFFSARPPYAFHNLWVRTWDGTSWSITDLGGDMPTGHRVATATWGVGHMAVFHRSTGDKLYMKQYANGAWQSSWTEIGSGLWGNPVSVSPGPGKLVVCAAKRRGTGGVITSMLPTIGCRVFQNGSWGSWTNLINGSYAPKTYSLVSSMPGTVTLISAPDATSAVSTAQWNGSSWGGWISTNIPNSAKLLDATSWGQGRVDVLWRLESTYQYTYPLGSPETYEWGYPLQHAWVEGGPWQSETITAAGTVLGARIVTWGPNRLDVFFDRVNCVNISTPFCSHVGSTHLYAN